jgi:hypothetical protein
MRKRNTRQIQIPGKLSMFLFGFKINKNFGWDSGNGIRGDLIGVWFDAKKKKKKNACKVRESNRLKNFQTYSSAKQVLRTFKL